MNTPDELIPLIDWWKKDGKKCLAMALVAGMAALGAYLWMSKERRLDAEAAVYASGVGEFQIQDLENAVQKYGDREVGAVIKLRLAKKYVELGDYTKALEVYTALVNEKSVSEALLFAPEYGVASCQESLYNWAEAKKAYDVIAEGPASAYAFDAKLGSARCYAFIEGVTNKTEKLEALKKDYEKDALAVMRIEKTIEAVNGWEKREAPLPPVEMVKAEEVPAANIVPPVADATVPSAVEKAPVVEKSVPAGGASAPQPEKAK
ncbi:MAG: hypothetical protein J6W10_09160 [Kiritimatiellae bacterium]|nr:hypothetical protein [Kiritimatiellia bacterium]